MSDDDIIDDKALDELLRRGAEDVTDKKHQDCESDLEWCSDAETNTSDVLENALGLEAPPLQGATGKDQVINNVLIATPLTQVCPVVAKVKKVIAATAETEAEEFDRLVPALKVQKTESLDKRLQKIDEPESTWQEFEQAIRLQLQIVEAATFGLKDKFLPLLRALQKVKLSKEIMMKTGLGVLVADSRMWPDKLQPEVKVLEMTWRNAQRKMNPVYGIENVQIHTEMVPWNNQKRELFMEKASHMVTYMELNGNVKAATEVYKLAGVRLVFNGYNDIRELDSVVVHDIASSVSSTAVR